MTRYTAAVVVAALTFSNTDAFSVRPVSVSSSSFVTRPAVALPTTQRTSTGGAVSGRQHQGMTMLVETSGGLEELAEWTERTAQSNPVAKRVRKSPAFFKIASLATVPLSAALGFGLVPSRRLYAHGVGAVLTGVAGLVGKSRLDALTASNALPALAQALVDHELTDPLATQAAVRKVQADFGIEEDEEFAELCTEVYATYLRGMVKFNPIPKTSELKELEALKTALSLEPLQVGEAHYQAAVEWYRQTCLYTPTEELDDPAHPDRQAMDKFLFLSERALTDETPEAFKFEMARIAKAFDLDYTTVLDRVAETARPFYVRALQSTRSKLGTAQVNSSMLERARKTLGIGSTTARDLHIAAYNAHVRQWLGLPSREIEDDDEDVDDEAATTTTAAAPEVNMDELKFAEGATEELDQLQDILGLSDTDAAYEITLEATPLFQSTALATLNKVLDKDLTPDQAWEIMEERREELLMPEESTQKLLSSMVMQALGGPLETTNKFAKVNNEAATYDNLLEALEAKEALIAILGKSGWDAFDKFDETFCNPWDKQSANGFLSSEERIKLYRIFLNRSILKAPDGKLTDEMDARIKEVQGLLGITDMQAEIEARGAFGPFLQKAMQVATDEIVADYTAELAENMKAKVDDVVETYRLNEDFLRETGAAYYDKAVATISDNAPGGIPTSEMTRSLDALRDIFRLSKEDVAPSHLEHFGSVYKKSVLEAMGSTGVIRPEVREALDTLRSRLGVSEDSTRKLFLEAVEEKMVPMAEWVGSEMERTLLSQKELGQRRGKDMGEDLFQTGKGADGVLGLGAEVNIMSDIMELVDFYRENEVAEVNEDGETVYPVTALGADAVDQELAELLYRQFVVGAFQAQGEKAARYEDARATFGGILGLDQSKLDEIGNNIGSTVYDNLVGNAMKTKGSLDQQDMMFLANVQTKLGLSSEEGEKMLLNSQKKILSEQINAIMDDPTPEALKDFRERCNSMGVDLKDDVGISKQRLARMFESEIVPGLKNGEITAEDSDVLAEIQESLGLDSEECESMFESTLTTLSKSAMDLISSEILRGRDDNAVGLIHELVRYAAFTDGNLGLSVDEPTAYKVVNIYESLDFEDTDKEVVDNNLELLKIAVGLSEGS